MMSQNVTAFLESQVSSTRTALDILWSCLFTIFACTWTVQHLNVPSQRESCGIKPGWRGDLKYRLKNFGTSVKWMILTILAPEVLLAMNAGQLRDALKTVKELKKYADEDGVPWTLTHSLFANMGGFVMREFAPARARSSSYLCCQGGEQRANSKDGDNLELCPQAASTIGTREPSTKRFTLPELEAQAPKGPLTSFVLAYEILSLRKKGIIKLPYITRDEIMDKGKSDGFGRVIAICQTLWLVVQMIVRASRHLEVSQLEIGTAAFTSCAITTYLLNWHKPKGVVVPWTLCSFSGSVPREILAELSEDEPSYFGAYACNGIGLDRMSSVPDYHSYTDSSAEWALFLLSSVMFGAIHFAALKSTFPSHAEKVFWCVASAVCTGVFVLFVVNHAAEACYKILLGGFSVGDYTERVERGSHFYIMGVLFLIIPIYIIARLFLVVELFRCLFFLPPSAFVGTWVASVPHVS